MGVLVLPKTTDQEWIINGGFAGGGANWRWTFGITIAGQKCVYNAAVRAEIIQDDVDLPQGSMFKVQYDCDSLLNCRHRITYYDWSSDWSSAVGTRVLYITSPYHGGSIVLIFESLNGNAQGVFDNVSVTDWPAGAAAAYTFCETWGFCPGSGHRFEHWQLNGNIMQGIRNRAIPMNILYKTEPP